MIAVLDNYDSFTYNLVYLLAELNEEVRVCTPQTYSQDLFDQASHIILSPGPKHPKDSKLNQSIIQDFYPIKPILGICLGHQCIAYSFGAEVTQGREPIHGKTSHISFQPCALFQGLQQGFQAMRYHSLVVRNLPQDLQAIAWSEDGVIMAIKHQIYATYGVQFHPESILSNGGKQILQNFCLLSS